MTYSAAAVRLFLWMTALVFPALTAHAAIVATGFSTISTTASLAIPLNPNRDTVPYEQVNTSATQAYLVTVTGGIGRGAITFDGAAYAESFSGSYNSEYMDSYSGITNLLQSEPYLPQGSTSNYCHPCVADISLDTPTAIIFTVYAHVDYSYFNMTGIDPAIQGITIFASAWLGPFRGVYSYDAGRYLSDAVVTFTPLPEPASFAVVAGALAISSILRARKGRH